MKNLFALETSTDFKRHFIALGVLGVVVLTLDILLIEKMRVGGYEAGLFTLCLGLGVAGLVIWHAFITSPFRHIETSLDAEKVEQAVRFAETCPLNRRELSQAITGYLQVKSQPRQTNGVTPPVQPQEAEYEPTSAVI